ncbi:50S ribosomal protein L3 [Seleniivibrio sp.]|uniref:50S ribosomal protein L3 n=1 Tax=Seleniivibrio sp. TaxID=2898801 RepID=UPI0025CDAC7B|nr:50S ribosomal protein L3 [Seleniivibrio sp.]MCD8552477.1 50S ribosomal protein L3 [Seleniivibrio sp.]
MAKAIIGKKVGMTQVFKEDGTVVPVTVVQAGPCVVTEVRSKEKDGYCAIQLGFEEIVKDGKVNKPMAGYFKKQGVAPHKYLKEFRTESGSDKAVGEQVNVTIFEEGDLIDVQGTSIGKGFQGVVKRYGFAGGPKTHGSHFHNVPGSIGMCEFPGETAKGRKMPGRMGGKTVSVQNLQVVKIIPETNLLLIKGAIPGYEDGVVYIKQAVKAKK